METRALERYLHAHIPLSGAMGVAVRTASREGVTLAVPLAPNLNHSDTLFGGSAVAVAILAAWSLIHVRLQAAGIEGRIVIHANTMRYDRPVDGDCLAAAYPPEAAAWDQAMAALKRGRMARLVVQAGIMQGAAACRFEGEFVILPPGA
jgi:thioesterase domain-containing protein